VKQDYQLSSIIQQNRSLSPTKQENQLDLENQKDVPKICTIFSLNNESKVDSEEAEDAQMGGGIFEEMVEGEDEESIEEFDPEDPAFQEDEEESVKSSAAIYKYDMTAKSYVRMDESEAVSMKSKVSQISESEGEKDGVRQPNILKRRLLMPPMMIKSIGEDEAEGEIEDSLKECKMQKLDLNNPLNVNSAPEEDGIMYVTVKGSKPNEILLVKVSNELIVTLLILNSYIS